MSSETLTAERIAHLRAYVARYGLTDFAEQDLLSLLDEVEAIRGRKLGETILTEVARRLLALREVERQGRESDAATELEELQCFIRGLIGASIDPFGAVQGNGQG
jgi:hypothetical protein